MEETAERGAQAEAEGARQAAGNEAHRHHRGMLEAVAGANHRSPARESRAERRRSSSQPSKRAAGSIPTCSGTRASGTPNGARGRNRTMSFSVVSTASAASSRARRATRATSRAEKRW